MSSLSHPPADLNATVRAVAADPDESVAFGRVVDVALSEITGSDLGGVSELRNNTIRTRAASDPHVGHLDRAQYRTQEGPCLTAAGSGEPVVVCNDLATDRRWPLFAQAATELGVRSVISFTLSDGPATIGALNLYGRSAHAFSPEASEAGALLAAHAALVLMASRARANLNFALESRDAIGQAKGILMERYKFDEREAFLTLIAVSQHSHSKLRDVAEHLRTTGELPGLA